jgi:hypothetical protein
MSGIFQLQQTKQAVCFTSFVTITLDVNAVIGVNINESRKIKGGGGCGRQLFQNNRTGSRNEMTHSVWLRTHLLQHITSRHWLISSRRFEEMSFENLDDKCDIFLHNVENPPPSDVICFPRTTQSSRSNIKVYFLNLTTNTKLSDFSKIWYIYSYLTAVGLTPGGSSTSHIYTQTVHLHTNSTHNTEIGK